MDLDNKTIAELIQLLTDVSKMPFHEMEQWYWSTEATFDAKIARSLMCRVIYQYQAEAEYKSYLEAAKSTLKTY